MGMFDTLQPGRFDVPQLPAPSSLLSGAAVFLYIYPSEALMRRGRRNEWTD